MKQLLVAFGLVLAVMWVPADANNRTRGVQVQGAYQSSNYHDENDHATIVYNERQERRLREERRYQREERRLRQARQERRIRRYERQERRYDRRERRIRRFPHDHNGNQARHHDHRSGHRYSRHHHRSWNGRNQTESFGFKITPHGSSFHFNLR